MIDIHLPTCYDFDCPETYQDRPKIYKLYRSKPKSTLVYSHYDLTEVFKVLKARDWPCNMTLVKLYLGADFHYHTYQKLYFKYISNQLNLF